MSHVRFRFRLRKKLELAANEYRLVVQSREVILTADDKDVPIRDSNWLVMNARGFESEQDAKRFAVNLKAACEVSAIATRIGVDSGRDMPTSWFSQHVKASVLQKSGFILRDCVHGIDVFDDDPRVRIGQIKGTGTVRANPDQFLADLSVLHGELDCVSEQTTNIIILLNYALMVQEPVAQIVFAISAVEMLGQTESWSTDQRELLQVLAEIASTSQGVTTIERLEVAEAIRKGLHRLSLRQGVFRFLAGLGLEHLKQRWDELYSERSSLVHGLAPKPGVDYTDLAVRTMTLCGHILMKAISREIKDADRHVEIFYKLS